MAAVEFAWESQSIRRVGWLAAARQAARFTAVVVFPTPPFWFATAMIRDKRFLASENLAKPARGCKMFHVEHPLCRENRRGTLAVFHVERSPAFPMCQCPNGFTSPALRLFHVKQERSWICRRTGNPASGRQK